MDKQLCCLVLAAGEGTRMKSHVPKVLCEVLFKPMICWVLDAVKNCGIKNTCVVTGYKSEVLIDYLKSRDYDLEFAYQEKQRGTAHAVMSADEFLKKHINEDILILGGDSPFIDEETIKESYILHRSQKNSVTIITSQVENPFGYGRIVRDEADSKILSIAEEKDASELERQIKEVNSGMYWFNVRDLANSLGDISEKNAQKEYYLTAIIKIFIEKGLKVSAYKSSSSEIVFGANDCAQLKKLNEIAKKKVVCDFLSSGVSIPCPDGVMIGKDVKIESGTRILPNTVILGKTYIKSGCTIGPFCEISDCTIESGSKVKFSFCEKSDISESNVPRPFEALINNRRVLRANG